MKLKRPIFISLVVIAVILLPSVYAMPINSVAPTPHSTYHKGDAYTTIYSPIEIAPPNETKPLKITIKSLTNDTVINSSNLTLSFDLTLESPSAYHPIILQGLVYKPSWQTDNITINVGANNQFIKKTLPFTISIANVTDGERSIAVYASAMYEYETARENKTMPVSGMEGIPPYGNYLFVYSDYYFMEGSSSVNFVVETSPKATPSPTPKNVSPNIESQSVFTAVTVVIIAVAVASLIFRRHQKTPN